MSEIETGHFVQDALGKALKLVERIDGLYREYHSRFLHTGDIANDHEISKKWKGLDQRAGKEADSENLAEVHELIRQLRGIFDSMPSDETKDELRRLVLEKHGPNDRDYLSGLLDDK